MPHFEYGDMLIADPATGVPGVIRIKMSIKYALADDSAEENLEAIVAVPYDVETSIAQLRHLARQRLKALLQAAINDAGQ